MTTITQAELISLIEMRARRGCFFTTITARTIPEMRKTGNPFKDNCFKVSRVNGALNWIYQNSVNNQRDREGNELEFTAKPRKWGNRVSHTPFVTHVRKGETRTRIYLELKVERALGHEYQDRDGNPIDQTQLEPFLPAKQSNAEYQGVEKEIILRDYDVENILAITLDGVDYSVVTTKELVEVQRVA